MMEKSSPEQVLQNLADLRRQVKEAALEAGRDPDSIQIMAVTKTVPAPLVNAAIAGGITLLGENRAQELLEKYPDYHLNQAEVHFIGHLQTNKVRQIVDKVTMIHSVDRLSLAKEISRRSQELGKTMDILLEINVGDEASKSGMPLEQAEGLAEEIAGLPALRIRGLMAIPPICGEIHQIEHYFSEIRQLSVDIGAKNRDNMRMDILSMGMSGDFVPAIRQGSTMIRLGTALFGSRHVQ
ncbi:YggS family pyridoxal phosphate-dependent enzyme [Oscillospiraceae bacterium MB08-C2-2]|nr:YggS family pyridoxal phosphate-dependent enzyme [Oscillospiraceae bacterium MB08-C2-2]